MREKIANIVEEITEGNKMSIQNNNLLESNNDNEIFKENIDNLLERNKNTANRNVRKSNRIFMLQTTNSKNGEINAEAAELQNSVHAAPVVFQVPRTALRRTLAGRKKRNTLLCSSRNIRERRKEERSDISVPGSHERNRENTESEKDT